MHLVSHGAERKMVQCSIMIRSKSPMGFRPGSYGLTLPSNYLVHCHNKLVSDIKTN